MENKGQSVRGTTGGFQGDGGNGPSAFRMAGGTWPALTGDFCAVPGEARFLCVPGHETAWKALL